ncbi:MAG: hypothetical protein K8S23_13315 [Candidatus Cloacimonetes bacterium]|nr:hypothetical protein [Candidatus Cloacimonadota bacterium]
MKKYLINLIFIILCVLLNSEESDVTFKYGLIGKQSATNDSLFLFAEDDQLIIGNEVKLNLEYQKGKYLYVLYLTSDSEFQLLFSSISQQDLAEENEIFTSLPWMKIEEKKQTGKLFIISALKQLQNLEKNIKNYSNAKGKNKAKFFKKILNEISNYHIGVTETNSENFVKRLEKPIIGGVTFRNSDKFNIDLPFLIEQKLTHECKGVKIAVVEIKLF